MKNQIFLAAQYLIETENQFTHSSYDDCLHSSLSFDTDKATLSTNFLSLNGDTLALNYRRFTLDWNSPKGNAVLRLDGATHKDVINWLIATSKKFLGRKLRYDFNNDVLGKINKNHLFKLVNLAQLDELKELRTLAQYALESILENNNLSACIKVRPKHFDTGTTVHLDRDPRISVELGLAKPDDLCNEYYLYVSGFVNGEYIDVSNLKVLQNGKWVNGNFKGAILPATYLVELEAVGFYQEALDIYKSIEVVEW